MALSTDQDYEAYLDRFSATRVLASALSSSEFHRHSERLDELHLVDIECGLTVEQQDQLDELSLLLLEESLDETLYEDDDPLSIIDFGDRRVEDADSGAPDSEGSSSVEPTELRPEPLVDDPEVGQSHPVVSPRNRREVWRLRRHRRG